MSDLEKVQSELAVEEFSIMELEDRLELADRCNENCGCPKPTEPAPIIDG